MLAVVHVPSANWRDAVGVVDKSRGDADHEFLMPGYPQQLYDSIIDVLDVRSGAVLARHRVDGTLFLTSGGTPYRPVIEPSGMIRVEIFDVRVQAR
jgi:hypothetical protein